MNDINLGILEHGPHADLIRHMAMRCAADSAIQAVWVCGSLAAGLGDAYSDVEFRIGVKPGQIGDKWRNPDWDSYLPIRPVADDLMVYGGLTALHRMVLADDTLLDFTIHDSPVPNSEPKPVILTCRNPQFRAALEGHVPSALRPFSAFDGPQASRFLVDYWITTHEQMEPLARQFNETAFARLYGERIALLRAWFMQWVGKDVGAHVTPRMLRALHHGLEGRLTAQQDNLLGMASRTPGETVAVIEAIRAEMAIVGRWLAAKYQFPYPYELEEVVLQTWNDRKSYLLFQ
jgi:hypothetical protein